eukprot:Sspe_Gene.3484::Locus_1158_Transcript_1_1_Confidence_1.000_Length_2391::g.3484::m.3484
MSLLSSLLKRSDQEDSEGCQCEHREHGGDWGGGRRRVLHLALLPTSPLGDLRRPGGDSRLHRAVEPLDHVGHKVPRTADHLHLVLRRGGGLRPPSDVQPVGVHFHSYGRGFLWSHHMRCRHRLGEGEGVGLQRVAHQVSFGCGPQVGYHIPRRDLFHGVEGYQGHRDPRLDHGLRGDGIEEHVHLRHTVGAWEVPRHVQRTSRNHDFLHLGLREVVVPFEELRHVGQRPGDQDGDRPVLRLVQSFDHDVGRVGQGRAGEPAGGTGEEPAVQPVVDGGRDAVLLRHVRRVPAAPRAVEGGVRLPLREEGPQAHSNVVAPHHVQQVVHPVHHVRQGAPVGGDGDPPDGQLVAGDLEQVEQGHQVRLGHVPVEQQLRLRRAGVHGEEGDDPLVGDVRELRRLGHHRAPLLRVHRRQVEAVEGLRVPAARVADERPVRGEERVPRRLLRGDRVPLHHRRERRLHLHPPLHELHHRRVRDRGRRQLVPREVLLVEVGAEPRVLRHAKHLERDLGLGGVVPLRQVAEEGLAQRDPVRRVQGDQVDGDHPVLDHLLRRVRVDVDVELRDVVPRDAEEVPLLRGVVPEHHPGPAEVGAQPRRLDRPPHDVDRLQLPPRELQLLVQQLRHRR